MPVILFALKYWRETALVLLLAGLVAAVRANNAFHVNEGIRIAIQRRADSTMHADSITLKILADRARHVDTIYAHDTVTLAREVRLTSILHDTVVQHLTDTVLVKQYIARTDSAIRACTALANDCATAKRIAAERIATLEDIVRAADDKMAGLVPPRSCTTPSVISALLGGGASFVIARNAGRR